MSALATIISKSSPSLRGKEAGWWWLSWRIITHHLGSHQTWGSSSNSHRMLTIWNLHRMLKPLWMEEVPLMQEIRLLWKGALVNKNSPQQLQSKIKLIYWAVKKEKYCSIPLWKRWISHFSQAGFIQMLQFPQPMVFKLSHQRKAARRVPLIWMNPSSTLGMAFPIHHQDRDLSWVALKTRLRIWSW